MGFVAMIIFVVLLVVLIKMKAIEQKQAVGLFAFWVITYLLAYVIQSVSWLQDIIKSNAYLVPIFFVVFSLMYVARTVGWMSAQWEWRIVFAIIILLMIPWMIGYFSGDRAAADFEGGLASFEARTKNTDIWGGLMKWIDINIMKGNGTYIEGGEQEDTYEFIGVKMEEIEPWKDFFFSDEPVHIDIDYSANSYFPITIVTGCKIDGVGLGKIDSPYIEASLSQYPRVRCTFDELPKGTHVVDVIAVYSYQSTSRVPLKFMDKDLSDTLLILSRDSGNEITPESYVGGTQNALTTAGPLVIASSNTKIDGISKMKMPILLDRQDVNKNPTRLRFQIQVQDTLDLGKLSTINQAEFNLPQGLLLKNCDFGSNNNDQPLPYVEEDGRWIVTVVDDFSGWTDLKTLSCEIGFDENYLDLFLPEKMKWSPQTIYFTLDYNYQLQRSIMVQVN